LKRLLITLLSLLTLTLIGGALFLRLALGISVLNPGAVFDLAGGMAAKLGCSARYITGMSPEQVKADLASYSGLLQLVSITNNDANGQVIARLPPGASHSATFREGLGCSLDIGNTAALDTLVLPAPIARQQTNAGLANALLASQLEQDNAAGLQTRALLVMSNGQTIGEAYAPGFDETSQHLGWSMGKSLISLLFGRLEMTAGLSVSETALFPAWRDNRRDISIEHLLHMSSGLGFNETYLPGSDATRMLFNAYSASAVALEKPSVHPPGTRFAYSSGTTNLLSRLLFERVGGTPAGAYGFLHKELLAPLGLAHTIVEPDPSGVFVGSSYVYATARDWAQLGQLMVADGVHAGERLLSADWVRRATQPNSSGNEPRYGYQFWLNAGGDKPRWPDLPADAFAMQGNREQIVMMIPSRNLVLVRLGWTAVRYPYNATFSKLLSAISADANNGPDL